MPERRHREAAARIPALAGRAAFVGYLVAHDGYHWGEIGIALAQSGRPLDRKVAYGM